MHVYSIHCLAIEYIELDNFDFSATQVMSGGVECNQPLVTMHQHQFVRRVVLQHTINEFIQSMSLRSQDQKTTYRLDAQSTYKGH